MDSEINPLKDHEPHCSKGLPLTDQCQMDQGMDHKRPLNKPSIGSPKGSQIQFYTIPIPNSHSNTSKKFWTNTDQNLKLNKAAFHAL